MSLVGLVLAAAFLWFFQCSLFSRLWQRGLSASVSFCEEAVCEGDTAALEEIISNAKYLPLPALHVKFQMGRELVFSTQENSVITDRNYRSDIFSCLPWQEIRRHLTFTCKKRGYYRISQLDLTSYDLLWTSRFYAVRPADTALYVYPAPADPLRLRLPLQRLTGALAARNALLRDPFDLQSIRDYAPGDPYRDINWKAAARTAALKVNVHTPAADRRVLLLLDGDADRIWSDGDLKEETVRLAAALADSLIRQQIPVGLRSNARDCLTGGELTLIPGAGKAHRTAILRLLARADLEDGSPAADEQRKRRPMEELVQELASAPSSAAQPDAPLCVLLSPCQRDSLGTAFRALAERSPGSQWILPLRPGEPLRLTVFPEEPQGLFVPWETVPAVHS